MYRFDYHRPTSLAAASEIYKHAEEASFLAGGQTLLPTMKQRLAQPTDVIDLAAVSELEGIEVSGDEVRIGAMTRHAEVSASGEVGAAIPALAELAGSIGDAQVRNRGTLGGSVANSDPAADYPAAVLGLGAIIETSQREIAAEQYFIDLFETALDSGEIIKAIRFPIPRAAAYRKFPNPASRYAMVGVFVARFDAGVRVAVTGAGPCAFRVADFEAALDARFAPGALEGIDVDATALNADPHASAEYRAHLVSVMAQRAVAAIS